MQSKLEPLQSPPLISFAPNCYFSCSSSIDYNLIIITANIKVKLSPDELSVRLHRCEAVQSFLIRKLSEKKLLRQVRK